MIALIVGLGWMLLGIGVTLVVIGQRRRETTQDREADMTALDLAAEAASLLEAIEAESISESRALCAARSACAALVAVIAMEPEKASTLHS